MLAALCAIVLTLGAFAFSFAGFGFGLVTLPLLSLALPMKTAIVFQIPYAFCLVSYQFWHFRRDTDWRAFWPLWVGSAVTIPLGSAALMHLPESFTKRALAAFIVSMILLRRLGVRGLKGQPGGPSPARGVLWGMLSGLFQGAYTTGGPPAVLYIARAVSTPAAAKGLLGAYFVWLYVITIGWFAYNGLFTREWLANSLIYSPAVVAGAVLGYSASRRIEGDRYVLVVDMLLIAACLLMWAT